MGLQAMLRMYGGQRNDIGKLPPPAGGVIDEAIYYPFVSQQADLFHLGTPRPAAVTKPTKVVFNSNT